MLLSDTIYSIFKFNALFRSAEVGIIIKKWSKLKKSWQAVQKAGLIPKSSAARAGCSWREGELEAELDNKGSRVCSLVDQRAVQ